MQAQQYSLPLRQDFYHAAHGVYPGSALPDHYFSTGDLNHTSFSGGSSLSYPHQDYEYRYFPDRGDSARLSSSSITDTSLSATGMAITGGPVSSGECFRPEGIAGYQQQQWQWPSVSAPVHGLPAASVPCPMISNYSTVKSALNYGSVVLSPAAQLPTPASMAVLLNPNSRSEMHTPQAPLQPAPARGAAQAVAARPLRPVELDPGAVQAVHDSQSREKKHGCTMCHKRFDRPSTLRKHLLVHTGEKAFVCDTCGRRFGVASNLNRHVRRCVLKPVHTAIALSANSPSAAVTSPVSVVADPNTPPSRHLADAYATQPLNGMGAHKRIRTPSQSSVNATPPSGSSDHTQSPQQAYISTAPKPKSPTHKRRRRAPSPSQWIPNSLLSFNLSPPEAQKSTPVPLPPVRRNLPKEERDSWDENVASSPYHPCGWKDVLPGPGLGLGLGLGGKDVRNLNIGSNGGFMLGRVLVL